MGTKYTIKVVPQINGERTDYLLQVVRKKTIYYMKKIKLLLHDTIQKGSGWIKYINLKGKTLK